MSIWLVGSSSMRILGFLRKILHSARRTFSPPDKSQICLNTSSPQNWNAPSALLASVLSSIGNSFWKSSSTVSVEKLCVSVWSKYPTCACSPNIAVPSNAFCICIIVFNIVDFPEPLLPITPTFCPRLTIVVIVPRGLSYPKVRLSSTIAFSTVSLSGWKPDLNVPVSKGDGAVASPILSICLILACAIAALDAL